MSRARPVWCSLVPAPPPHSPPLPRRVRRNTPHPSDAGSCFHTAPAACPASGRRSRSSGPAPPPARVHHLLQVRVCPGIHCVALFQLRQLEGVSIGDGVPAVHQQEPPVIGETAPESSGRGSCAGRPDSGTVGSAGCSAGSSGDRGIVSVFAAHSAQNTAARTRHVQSSRKGWCSLRGRFLRRTRRLCTASGYAFERAMVFLLCSR